MPKTREICRAAPKNCVLESPAAAGVRDMALPDPTCYASQNGLITGPEDPRYALRGYKSRAYSTWLLPVLRCGLPLDDASTAEIQRTVHLGGAEVDDQKGARRNRDRLAFLIGRKHGVLGTELRNAVHLRESVLVWYGPESKRGAQEDRIGGSRREHCAKSSR